MRVHRRNGSQVGHEDDIINLNNLNEPNGNDLHLISRIGSIRLQPAEGNVVIHIARTMLYILLLQVLFDGLSHEDPMISLSRPKT